MCRLRFDADLRDGWMLGPTGADLARCTLDSVELRSFDQSLPMSLLRARESVMLCFRPILAEHNISEQQWRVLRALDNTDVPLSAGTLAERTALLGPSLSRMLVSLEERKLIHRSTATDGRTSEIEISPDGKDLVATVGPASEAAYSSIEEQLGPDELAELLRLLERLTALDRPAVIDER